VWFLTLLLEWCLDLCRPDNVLRIFSREWAFEFNFRGPICSALFFLQSWWMYKVKFLTSQKNMLFRNCHLNQPQGTMDSTFERKFCLSNVCCSNVSYHTYSKKRQDVFELFFCKLSMNLIKLTFKELWA